jgi:hypothetical protein
MKKIYFILILLPAFSAGCGQRQRELFSEYAQRLNHLGRNTQAYDKTGIYGYPTDTSLKIAVQRFNDKFDFSEAAKRPALTEEEVLAAVRDFPTSDIPSLKTALQKIKEQKLMPRGSLLEATGNETIVSELDSDHPKIEEVECYTITLYLGLDERPRQENELDPGQICLIRRISIKGKP